jgi:NAD(P)-dependent dehydrogenase (short-subunit alcohol dehydrogenase family)
MAPTYSKGADTAASVVKAIESSGGEAVAIQADAANPEAVQAAVDKTVTAFDKLDIRVNNAGTAILKTFEETTLEASCLPGAATALQFQLPALGIAVPNALLIMLPTFWPCSRSADWSAVNSHQQPSANRTAGSRSRQ